MRNEEGGLTLAHRMLLWFAWEDSRTRCGMECADYNHVRNKM